MVTMVRKLAENPLQQVKVEHDDDEEGDEKQQGYEMKLLGILMIYRSPLSHCSLT
jgi:hypothetical protein